MKYAMKVPVTMNKNSIISLFDTGATISCLPKACFNKLQPKPMLVQTNMHKVNGADRNSVCPIGSIAFTLEFPKKFQQQFIIYEQLL